MVAEEEIGDLVAVAVLLGELLPEDRGLVHVVAGLVDVAQPDAVRLVFVVTAVDIADRGDAEHRGPLRREPRPLVAERLRGDGGGDAGDPLDEAPLRLAAAVLMGGVRDLMAEHDGELVVVEILHQPAEDVDRVVGHCHRVPRLVVDDVDAHLVLRDVGGQEPIDDPPRAVHLRPLVDEPPDHVLLPVGPPVRHLLRFDVLLLRLVGRGEDLALHELGAVLLGRELRRQ